jgi:heavy metal translocating P-type ATPase
MENSEKCTHCGEKIVVPSVLKTDEKELMFCCHGCKTVYEILHEKGLAQYYQLRDNAGDGLSGPVIISNDKYLYLDNEEFLNKYSKIIGETRVVKFYLEGIHCVACLWLLEKLPEFVPGVLTSELNMSKSICTVTAKLDTPFSTVAKQFETLGYKPHPVMESSEVEELAKREDRKMLIKIAVAFACAGNVMLLATSIYAGLEEHGLKEYFRWLNLVLSLPAIFYSATPFYQSAWSAIKNKKISIDIPIVVAIILVTLSGTYSLFIGSDHLYFDSITVLIFLLLFARFVLKKAQQRGLSATEISSFFANQVAYKPIEGSDQIETVHAKFLKQHEKIIVPEGENIPVDGLVLSGTSNINTSLLTGESIPEKVTKGSYVYSGTINLDSPLTIQVMKTAENSRLGKILKSVESGWSQKADIVLFADLVAKYFVYTVFTLASIVAISFTIAGEYETGLVRALTLIIITCPCALGLTTPLALTLTLGRLAKNGIIVKNEQIIEKLTKAKEIFLDKTGTLTYGSFQVSEWNELIELDYDIGPIIYGLEKRSKHPVARAIVQHLEKKYYENNKILNLIELEDFKEISGKGVSAKFNDNTYSAKASQAHNNPSTTTVGIFCNDLEVISILLKDELRSDAKEALELINKNNLSPYIISGDNQQTVNDIAAKLDLDQTKAHGNISPESKKEFIQNHPKAIMVGDGANDAIALSNAFVGIAVHGSVDISLRAADIYISKAGVKNLADAIDASHDTLRVIKRNLKFSLVYNIIGATLAVFGQITPLVAAVLMPISSLTVLASTFISTKKLKKLDQIR